MFDALVLAGGGKADPLAELEGVVNKAFIPINNRPLISYILKALEDAPSIEKIIVTGPVVELKALQSNGYQIMVAGEGDSMLENITAALQMANQNRPCLVVTGDIPMLNAAVVEEFINLCAPHDADLYYPVLSEQTCLNSYPDTQRTYVRLKEGPVTGGNIGLISPSWFIRSRDRLELFISYRKKPLKLLRILPFTLILKYFFKTLSLKDLEQFLSRLLDMKAQAVQCDCAEIGLDVDKPSDLEQVRKLL